MYFRKKKRQKLNIIYISIGLKIKGSKLHIKENIYLPFIQKTTKFTYECNELDSKHH